MSHGSWIDRRALLVMAVSLVMVGLTTGLSAEGEGQQVTIAGMVVGILEDNDGNFQRVYIQDDSLGQILVVDDEKGKELLGHTGSEVRATGVLVDISPEPGLSFGMQITVSDYELL